MIIRSFAILCLLVGHTISVHAHEPVLDSNKPLIVRSLRKNIKYAFDTKSGGVIVISMGRSKLIWPCKINEFQQFNVLKKHKEFDYIFTLKYDENETGFQFFIVNTNTLDVIEKKLGLADYIASKGNFLIFLNSNEDEGNSGEGIAIIDIKDTNKRVIYPDVIVDKETVKIVGSKLVFSGTDVKSGLAKKGEYLLRGF